jgi:uncharacterized protein YciI
MTRDLERFQLVLLRRPADAPEYDDETLDRLQQGHLAFLDDLRAKGLTATHGPVLDQPDVSLRGLVLYRVGSVEEALAIGAGDPLVVAGRLTLEGMTYLCPPGSLTAAGEPIQV